MPKRVDFQIIAGFIEPGSRVLDLGCGGGELLEMLTRERDVRGEGVEISEKAVRESLSKGLIVHHGDIDEGLDSYADDSLDYVILSHTLQMTQQPEFVIREMLRVGRRAIVSVPNFGHYTMRLQLLAGRMPVTKAFPYQWYDTPNIRHATIRDFRRFCAGHGFRIEEEADLRNIETRRSRFLSNLFARLAIFVLSGDGRPVTSADIRAATRAGAVGTGSSGPGEGGAPGAAGGRAPGDERPPPDWDI